LRKDVNFRKLLFDTNNEKFSLKRVRVSTLADIQEEKIHLNLKSLAQVVLKICSIVCQKL